jgi:hypothetical protein
MTEKVTLHFEGKLGLKSINPKAFDAATTVGTLSDKLRKAPGMVLTPQQQLLIFVTSGTDAFMPAPDQTIGDLFRMFGTDVDQIGRCLKVAYCTQVFQG